MGSVSFQLSIFSKQTLTNVPISSPKGILFSIELVPSFLNLSKVLGSVLPSCPSFGLSSSSHWAPGPSALLNQILGISRLTISTPQFHCPPFPQFMQVYGHALPFTFLPVILRKALVEIVVNKEVQFLFNQKFQCFELKKKQLLV